VIPFPFKIISGGQTGADRAGLDFAIESGLEHGGWCPSGRRCEDGVIPSKYNLRETAESNYQVRTRLNVSESNATIIVNRGSHLSPGSALTLNLCERLGRPYFLIKGCDFFDAAERQKRVIAFVGFLASHRPSTLNVAGNREGKVPGVADFTRLILSGARALAQNETLESVAEMIKDQAHADDPYQGATLFEMGNEPKRKN
jgi:hypothetical protein